MRTIAALSLLSLASVLTAFAACSSSTTSSAPAGPGMDAGTQEAASSDDAASTTPDVTVHAVIDLPRNKDTQSLSGTAYDAATRTLFTIQDKTTTFVPLVASEDLKSIAVGAPLTLTGRTDTAWDGEGVVLAGGGFIAVTVETEPNVERFDLSGKRTGSLAVPAHFAQQAPGNKGLESLTVSPSGKYLFTANEAALTIDGLPPTKTRGTTIRILRHDLTTDVSAEYAYRTEPLGKGTGGDMGVSELAAIDDDHLLVMERGYQSDFGNTVRIFRVDLSGATRVDNIAALSDATTVMPKTLLVDIGTLPSAGVTHPGLQPNPILDNYEALAIGPSLGAGRRALFVTSDDNASATQVARVLVLSVAGL